MPFCSICKDWAFGPGHQCAPTWNVWPEGNEEGFDPEESTVVFADDAEAAALRFADTHTDCDAWKDNLFVRQVGEQGQVVEFSISHYVQPVYEASIVKRKEAAPATPATRGEGSL